MYLARLNISGRPRYLIRESVPGPGGEYYVSRDLLDLGDDPARFIHYSDRDAFYLDPAVEASLREKGVSIDGAELDELFLPFLKPEARRRDEFPGFSPRNFRPRILTGEENVWLRERVHLFDKKRLYYLRYGSLGQERLFKAPLKLFLPLLFKSRDEIEQFFVGQEDVLSTAEYRQYVYVIFDLQKFFKETAARTMPAALHQDRLDEILEDEYCRLLDDPGFRTGLAEADLARYLSRYLVMFFDHDFPAGSFMEDYLRQFMDSRRSFRFPEKEGVAAYEEAGALFGLSSSELKKMNRRELTAAYRKLAHAHHPDKGGEQGRFVRLTELYKRLRKDKK